MHEWRLFAACNAAHHVLMYAYYSERAEMRWLRAVVPWTGAAQLGVGVGVDGWRLWQGQGELVLVQGRAMAVGLLAIYGWLYWGEVREARRRRRVEEGGGGE